MTDTCDDRMTWRGRENSSASQSKHDVPGEVLIGDEAAPAAASEATDAVRVAKLDVLAHTRIPVMNVGSRTKCRR